MFTTCNRFAAGNVVLVTVLAVVCGMFPGCSSGKPMITIEQQEALLSPIILGSGSVFMKVVNSGSGGDSLINVRLNLPNAVVELHDFQDGKMAKVDRIPVPSNSTTVLRPAGHHIMIFRMPRTIQEGSEVSATLVFEKYGEIRIPLKFRSSATSQSPNTYR